MTIIAAAIGPGGTWIGADGRATVGDLVTTNECRKWSLSPSGLWAFAGAGEVTFDSVLLEEAGGLWPDVIYPDYPDLLPETGEAGLRRLAGNIRAKLDAIPGMEFVRDPDCIFGDYRFAPLVATEGAIWRACSDLRSFDGPLEGVYQAGGAGSDYAVGAMSSLLAHGVTSGEALVRAGVETACRMSTLCGGSVVVQRIGRKDSPASCPSPGRTRFSQHRQPGCPGHGGRAAPKIA